MTTIRRELDNNEQEAFLKLIKACIQKDTRAQNMLYKEFFGYSKSIAMRYSSNSDDAKDILNRGFMKVFDNLDKYMTEFPFKAWLRTIMVNTALSHYRDNKRFDETLALENHMDVQYEPDIIAKLSYDEILTMVQLLPPAYRMVFVMHVVDGYNHREIGEMLGIQEVTSRSNFMKARLKLQLLIQKNHPSLFQNYMSVKRGI